MSRSSRSTRRSRRTATPTRPTAPSSACTSAPSASSICTGGSGMRARLAAPRVLEQQGRHRGRDRAARPARAARSRRDRRVVLARVRGMRQGRGDRAPAAVASGGLRRRRRWIHLGGAARARSVGRATRRAASVLATGAGVPLPRAHDRDACRRARPSHRRPHRCRRTARGRHGAARHRRLDGNAGVRGSPCRRGAAAFGRRADGVPRRVARRARRAATTSPRSRCRPATRWRC